MGTNYYATFEGQDGDTMHIGKKSVGWKFIVRLYPDQGFNTLYDWIFALSGKTVVITNEYGRILALDELLHTIMNPADTDKGSKFQGHGRIAPPGEGQWTYSNYEFC
jgi:hypothetical protein